MRLELHGRILLSVKISSVSFRVSRLLSLGGGYGFPALCANLVLKMMSHRRLQLPAMLRKDQAGARMPPIALGLRFPQDDY
jgi:hypothetical protein